MYDFLVYFGWVGIVDGLPNKTTLIAIWIGLCVYNKDALLSLVVNTIGIDYVIT